MSPMLSCGGVPDLFFEDNKVGRMFKEVWEADDAQVDAWLAEFGLPSPCEWTKPGSYIQNTVRGQLEKERRKNDIVLIPVGCTENHGRHTVSAMDTFFVSILCEAVRRKTAESGAPVAIALPPLMYGGHPYHHIGMPGTVMLREQVVEENLVDVMLGLWNDGFRKQIIVNNHGHLWMLETALHKFLKRYQLPGVFKIAEWHRNVKHFWRTKDQGGPWETNFVHADESETSVGLLLFPEMVDMSYAVDTEMKVYMPPGHIDNSIEGLGPPDALVGERRSRGHRVLRHARRRRGPPDRRHRAEGQAPGRRLRQVPDHGLRGHPGDLPGRHCAAGGGVHLPERQGHGAVLERAPEPRLEAGPRAAVHRPALRAGARSGWHGRKKGKGCE